MQNNFFIGVDKIYILDLGFVSGMMCIFVSVFERFEVLAHYEYQVWVLFLAILNFVQNNFFCRR